MDDLIDKGGFRVTTSPYAGGTVVTVGEDMRLLGVVLSRYDHWIDVADGGTVVGFGKSSDTERGRFDWDESFQDVLDTVREATSREAAGPAKAAFARLNTGVVAFACDLPRMGLGQGSFNAIAARPDADTTVARLAEWPLLAPFMGKDRGFDDAVASGRPDAILARAPAVGLAGLGAPALRRLHATKVGTKSAARLLKAAIALPMGLMPSSPEEWALAARLADAMEGLPEGLALTRKGTTLSRDYDAIRDLTCHEDIRGDRSDRRPSLFDHQLDDVAAAFAEEVVAPMLCEAVPEASDLAFDPEGDLGKAVKARALELLVGGGTVRDAYALSSRWHNGFAQVEAALPEASGLADVSWRSPLGAKGWRDEAGSAWTMTPLTTAKALREEGLAMGHCVGTKRYVRHCMAGVRAVFSLASVGRDGKVTREATLEIQRKADDDGFRVAQFLAAGNATPSQGANDALVRWRTDLRGAPLAWQAGAEGNVPLCHDWTDPTKNLAALAAWGRHVAPGLARLEADAIVGRSLIETASLACPATPRP